MDERVVDLATGKIKIADLVKRIEGAHIHGDDQVLVSGITHDSRKVVKGDIYVCISGFKVDGHDFALAAVENGAAALVVDHYLELEVPQIKVENPRQMMGFLAAEIYSNPADKLELIGVTGTNGKTTVTYLIKKIAEVAGKKTGIIGTLGARVGELQFPGNHTTPESTEIQRLLADMVKYEVDTAVMEVSSHALDLGRVNGCKFKAGIFTNLSQDHLDYHRNMEEYLEAKALLFAGMNTDQEQFAVLNADDAAFGRLKEKALCRIVTYAVEAEADYQAKELNLAAQGVSFEVHYKGQNQQVLYATPGKFSVYNALAAYAWAIESGYSAETVSEALAAIKGVPGRFESVRKGQPFQVIVDYAHTPDGLENVLETAREFTENKLITVFGCGGDRDKKKRPLMAEAASRWSNYVVITSDNPRTEDPGEIIQDILPGMSAIEYQVIIDRKEAIIHACSIASSGDTIVIAGKGHEDYQIIGTEKIHFDDKEQTEMALRGMGYVE